MASIQLRIVRSVGGTISTQEEISDVNIDRIILAMGTYFPGNTPQQLVTLALQRVITQVVNMTKAHEQSAMPIPEIDRS